MQTLYHILLGSCHIKSSRYGRGSVPGSRLLFSRFRNESRCKSPQDVLHEGSVALTVTCHGGFLGIPARESSDLEPHCPTRRLRSQDLRIVVKEGAKTTERSSIRHSHHYPYQIYIHIHITIHIISMKSIHCSIADGCRDFEAQERLDAKTDDEIGQALQHLAALARQLRAQRFQVRGERWGKMRKVSRSVGKECERM